MTDAGRASLTTRRFAVITLSAWAVAVALGLFAAPTGAAGYVSDALLLGSVFASAAMLVRAALANPRGSLTRLGWLIGAVAAASASVVGACLLAIVLGSGGAVAFDGSSPAITGALLIACAAVWPSVASMRHAPQFRADLVRTFFMAVAVWFVMVAALMAPGPAMPWSIGPRDPGAIVRVTLENLLMLWPALLCTAATLRLTELPRARGWVWVAAGIVMLSWGDVVYPLVDMGTAQFYPAMLWCLGIILVAVAGSRLADCTNEEVQP